MKSRPRINSKAFQPPKFQFTFEGKLQVYQGKAAWYFVNLPKALSLELDELFSDQKRGFGSLRVEANIDGVVWQTSIFPDSQAKAFMLPMKASVRKLVKLVVDNKVTITLEIKL